MYITMYFGSNVRFITKIHVTIVSYIFKREILSLLNFVFFKKYSRLKQDSKIAYLMALLTLPVN